VVGKEIEYSKVDVEGHGKLILASSKVEKLLGNLNYKVLETFKGESLVGKSYQPVFDYYQKNQDKIILPKTKSEAGLSNIWKVWAADFVTENDGTGIAHEAPAFGEDDYKLAEENGIPTIIHIGMDGRFYTEVTDFAGERVKWKGETQATDKKVCEFLASQNIILKTEIITHSYPLCWRCDTPLLNYATSSWFVAVSKMRDKLVEENKKVYWVPENVRDGRMGQWLEGARDWALSRNRYWGAPLPVWKSKDELFVPGSLKELQTRTKAKNNYFLVRHGETDANRKNMLNQENATASGTIDAVLGEDKSLNETGQKQAQAAGQNLKDKKIDYIFSSPFKRTLETAKIIAKELGISEDQIIVDERLTEWQVGKENNGKSWAQLYAENPGVNYFHKLMKGVLETKIDVQNRMTRFVKEMETKYEGKNIVAVSHKSPIACLYSRNNGELFEMGTGNLPVWHNAKNCEIVELNYKPLPTDESGAVNFHLPHIDELEVFDKNGNKMKREGGVFDCWFESGSMPYAQFHYPFENQELFKKNSPADFIAEAQDQTRGWFYTLMAVATLLQKSKVVKEPPFRNVVVLGHIRDKEGKKLSKSLGNYIDPMDLIEQKSADAVRFYLMTMNQPGEPKNFDPAGVDEVIKKTFLILMNVMSFGS
jgi:isoleucyl-tRNA synthetase